ncbi:MAG: outer membrane protein assembly factor BamD, partial [Albimonas sp.]
MIRRPALALMAVMALAACSDDGSDDPFYDPYSQRTAASIFAEGEAQLNDGEPVDAAQTFEELERVHPYSEWSKR